MNPILADWDTPFGIPPFDRIEDAHFRPAFDEAMAAHRAEIDAIASSGDAPTFENTIAAMERAGAGLDKVAPVFFHLAGVDTNPERQAIEREIAPKLAQHRNAILTDPRLFARIEALVEQAEDGLTDEQARVLDLYHEEFVRAGARLTGDERARMAAIIERLAGLGTAFSQNVLKDESEWVMWLTEEDVAGLPEFLIDAAKAEAERRGREGYAITLSRSSVEPFLTFSPRRDLREAAWRAWANRGEEANWPIIEETVRLRAERAALLGFPDFAHYKLDNQMAKTPEAVAELLQDVWRPALSRAAEEEAALGALAAEEGQNTAIEPWDWRYYAEKVRRRDYAIDEAETKPYLALDSVIEAAFDVAGRLFGLRFKPLGDVPLPHVDARAWEVKDGDGAHVGVFMGDYFARPSKRSGAWANALRSQERVDGEVRPIIHNTCNFAKGDPALLTWDDARTLFHEFGHALHGLLSDVTYPTIAGTAVPRDFVELPSQLYEHWLGTPAILSKHARHVKTGEPMPDALIEKLKAAGTFNQGFQTVEFTASALVDLAMHRLRQGTETEDFDGPAFEKKVLEEIGAPPAIPMRHRTAHFQHVFSGDGYSSGYYSYMWSEVMDADAFRAFEETGDVFNPALAGKLRDHVYAAGNRRDPAEAYVAFRGRMPGVDALLAGRGLAKVEEV